MDNVFIKGFRYEIFIGLKDQDSYEEVLTVNDFKDILCEICTKDNISFSLVTQFGGYTHNKGYTTETSLRIVIIGSDDEKITELGEILKKKINVDTILISKSELQYVFM